MNTCMQLAKWSAVPSAVLAAQIALAASDAFDAESALWAFIAVSLVMLIVWRRRLGRTLGQLVPAARKCLPQLAPQDRRFAAWSMLSPFAFLLVLQITILALFLSDASVAHKHAGTLWTLFAIVSIGFNQIAMGLGYMIMKGSRRWQAILASCPADPTAQPKT